MATARNCAVCGRAMGSNVDLRRKYCSDRCRSAAYRRSRIPVGAQPTMAVVKSLPVTVQPQDDGSLRAAVARELASAGQLDSARGRAALILAERIESGTEPGGAVATMVAQLRETLESASKSKGRSKLQELRGARADGR